ncbi:ribose 5-phosphate isomerase B [Hippea alviniae]|uniref:ribose 5-phosphate isomerase B n=1 Tax=Hippea alviniae TaxID=1279027 RepID=UPI0003B56A9E|nr:ribose 5-phosphate isomerase B [Hippea alviniae]
MIFIGSDHGGFELKEKIKVFLREKGVEFEDLGTFSEESCDYPDIAESVAQKVAQTDSKGILICGTGIGMSIAANKVKGIRCALCHDAYTAEYARKHNNANIIAFGGRTTGVEIAKQMVEIFLREEFEGGRHKRRIDKIAKMEGV